MSQDTLVAQAKLVTRDQVAVDDTWDMTTIYRDDATWYAALVAGHEVPRETVWKILSTSQPSYHEPCHRDIDKRFSGGAQPLVVLAHPPVLREPREGALHNPAAREDLEAPARKQLLPIDLPALFRPLLRPHHCDLLWRRLGSAMHDLDAQVQLLFHPVLAPALVPGIYP